MVPLIKNDSIIEIEVAEVKQISQEVLPSHPAEFGLTKDNLLLQININRLKTDSAVSYTHLDVYKRQVFIRMKRKKSTLEGFAGCNNIGGTHAEGRHGAIKFEPFSTLMACEERMATEQYVLKALVRANRYIINDKFLLLYDENILLATFEARYYK